MEEPSGRLPALPGGSRSSGHLCKTLRADQAGLYHPASAGHGGGRSGQPQGVQSPANQMAEILTQLQRIEVGAAPDDELLDVIRFLSKIMEGMKEDTDGR